MSGGEGSTPRLTGTGRFRGRTFDIGPGRTTVGRVSGSDIRLEDGTVSREHADLIRTGRQVIVTDLGSTNGTWVNDEQVIGSRELRDGDIVHFGSIGLKFAMLSGQPAVSGQHGVAATYDHTAVHAPAQPADPAGYPVDAGHHLAADDELVESGEHDTDGHRLPEDVPQGAGAGRAVAVSGYTFAVVGFGIWAYLVFSSLTGSLDASALLDEQILPGVPTAIAGFGLFAGGGVLAAIGTGMSRAARAGRHRR